MKLFQDSQKYQNRSTMACRRGFILALGRIGRRWAGMKPAPTNAIYNYSEESGHRTTWSSALYHLMRARHAVPLPQFQPLQRASLINSGNEQDFFARGMSPEYRY